MNLSILTPATATKLCSTSDVASELGCSSADELAVLETMIEQATTAIQSYCQRAFAKQEYRELVAGYGGPTLLLAVWPIVSVTQIIVDSVAVTDFSIQDPESGILWRRNGWDWSTQWTGRLAPKPLAGSEELIYQVDYYAGYDLPDALLPTLPKDIERAAIITVKDWFMNRNRNPSISQVVTPGSTMSVTYTWTDLPPTALRLLSRYRSEA